MKISVSSLGGAGEIGMNMYIYETDRYAVIVDCGVKFTKSDEIGVDLIIPDFSYIETIKHKKIMLIITHAHEDHIGAVPYLIKEYPDTAIVCGRYSWDILNKRLDEHNVSVNQIYIDDFKPFEWGDFEITAYPVSHSIHGTYAVMLKIAEDFKAVHISDYKIDSSPVTCTPFPLKEFIDFGKEGIDLLMADSTNICFMRDEPSRATFLPYFSAILNTDCSLSVFDANVVKNMRPEAFLNTSSIPFIT